MVDMQKRNNYTLYFAVFVVLSIIIFALSKTGILNPVSSIFQGIFSPVQKLTFTTFSNITNLSQNSELSNLKSQNRILTQKIVDQTKLQQDNKALRDQFATQNPKSSNLLGAEVIGAPAFIPQVSYPEVLVINKGKNDEIKVGQAVVFQNNLIGKIESASDSTSTVILITNSSYSFTAKTLSQNSQGVVKGQGAGSMIFDNVLLSEDLKKDDIVLTKGDLKENGVGLPPDLIVGKIKQVSKNPSDLFQKGEIQSYLDFTKLNKVFVVVGI